ncbi:MAG: glycosyltransferase family 4 protein [Thermodesulfobacterium sp.]|nr:glycosyltransferase family 4 protein [Thermodesulfobacterium sp.]
MKKIAFLLDRLGNRRHYLQFKILKKHGFIPYALVFEEYLHDANIPEDLAHFHPLPFKRNNVLRKFSFKFLKYLINFVKNEKIKVVLIHRWRFLRYSTLTKLFYPELKIIYHIVVGGTLKHPGRKLFFRLFKNKIDCLLVNSLALKDELLATGLVKPGEVELLYSSFDLSTFPENLSKDKARTMLNLPQQAFIFGMVAKFRPEKRQADLIKAFNLVHKDIPKAVVVFVGDGSTRKNCETLVKELSLKDKIIFVGKVMQEIVPFYLRAFDVLVHTSIREGMPLAVLEGLASGLPIIATDAEGVPDIFATEEPIGYLVPKEDVKAIAQALKKIYYLPKDEFELLGKNAKKRFLTAFSPEAFEKRTIEIFSKYF